MPRQTLLTRSFVELAAYLVDDFDLIDLLTLLSERCVEALDVSAAGVLLATPEGDLRAIASSSHALEIVEIFESQAEEGPCLECYRTGTSIIDTGLSAGDGHQYRFASLALECGFRSLHAFPMHVGGRAIGVLGLLRSDDGRLNEADAHDAQAFADVGTIAVLHRRTSLQGQVLNEQLQYALNSRIVIGQAKGVVAERLDLDLEQGFVQLRRFAHDNNLRLIDVAHDVIKGNLANGALGQP